MLCEPYERFACNELRSECYRRKLPVIKSGPRANATKAGFLRLLRGDDEARGQHGDGTANVLFTPPPRAVSPPTSPMAFVELPPRRPPRVEVPLATKRPVVADCGARGVDEQATKHQKVTHLGEPQPLSANSFFSTQASTSVASSVNNEEEDRVLEPGSVASSNGAKEVTSVDAVKLPRWERLHARLEVVNTKLQALYARRDQWLPCASGANDGSDVEFYEMMKRQLQRGLLECVSDA